MKTITALLASLLFVSTTALAADASSPKSGGKTDAPKAAVPAGKSDARAAAPVKVATGSQQNRMRECNKSAVGKKGDERRAFMKSCLSTRKG